MPDIRITWIMGERNGVITICETPYVTNKACLVHGASIGVPKPFNRYRTSGDKRTGSVLNSFRDILHEVHHQTKMIVLLSS
jgi:hypothetical protein